MKRIFLVLFLALLVSRPCTALERGGADGYVFALAASAEAETHCTGMTRDSTGLMVLLDLAQADGSAATVDAIIPRWKLDVQRAIRDKGEAQRCATIWRLFGPEGLHAIKRK